MGDLQPFRAVRYSGAAGPLADLVAPPYDAVGREERDAALLPQPVQRRPPDAARVARAGRRPVRRLALGGNPRPRGRAGRVAALGGVRRPRRGRAGAPRSDRLARGRAVRDGSRPAARADASAHPRGAAAPAPRDASPTGADLPAPGRAARRRASGPATRSRGERLAALAARGLRAELARRAQPADRGRPPPLRERSRARSGARREARIMALLVATSDPGPARVPDAPHVLAAAPSSRTLDGR